MAGGEGLGEVPWLRPRGYVTSTLRYVHTGHGKQRSEKHKTAVVAVVGAFERERGRRGSRGLSVIGGGGRGDGWLVSWLVGWCLTRVFRLLLLEKN